MTLIQKAVFSGIVGILLVLGFFVSVPFHKDYVGLDTLGVIQIILAVFLAVVLYAFDYYNKKRDEKKNDERRLTGHQMINRVFDSQLGLLSRLDSPAEPGRALFTDQLIDTHKFVKMVFPLNNQELSQIYIAYASMINADLLQEISDFIVHSNFLFSIEGKVNDAGINNLRNKIKELKVEVQLEIDKLEYKLEKHY